jgi:hypothetical protein
MNYEQTEKFLGIVSRERRVKDLEHEREIILKDVTEIIRSLSGVIAELRSQNVQLLEALRIAALCVENVCPIDAPVLVNARDAINNVENRKK